MSTSTPEVSGATIIKSKHSSFCSGGINKSLLTPCRQVGLSRKRKTSFNNSIRNSENLKTNINSININSATETTPVIHKRISDGRRKNNLFLNFPTTPNQESSVDSVLKNDVEEVLQTFTSEELFDRNSEFCIEEKITEDKKNISELENNTRQISNIEFRKIETNDIEQITSDHKNCNKLKRKLSSDFLNFENICINSEKSFSQTFESDSSDDDFVISKSSKTKHKNIEKQTKCRKAYSRKPSHCVTDNSSKSGHLNDPICSKKCKVQLQKLSEAEINSNNFIDNSTMSEKCNSKTTEDTDYFTSTPEEEMIKRKSLETKMTVLENQIKQKQAILENLRRASIYKNKHNIPELNQLTSLWLDGCVEALRDLLSLLQAHGPINLTTLLNNMQIPKEIVAKLPL